MTTDCLNQTQFPAGWLKADRQLLLECGFPVETEVNPETRDGLLSEALHLKGDQLIFDAELYHAGVERIVAAARALPGSVKRAALVGHNPGMTYAANHLAENLELDNLPTCAIVGIRN